MKKYFYLCVCCVLSISTTFSQENSSKVTKAEKRIQIKAQIEQLVNSKSFEFIGVTAFPLGLSPIAISSNTNSVVFSKDIIRSDMPFYGTGYRAINFGRDTGMRFQGKPEKFQIEKKAKGFEISIDVNSNNNTKTLLLSISDTGSAILTISSNDRSTISYQGEIKALKKE